MIVTSSKIIYFDRETIQNTLQEHNKGIAVKETRTTNNSKTNAEVTLEAKVHLGAPFFDRLKFLFSGSLKASYFWERNSMTTITSTELSDFQRIKDKFEYFPLVKLKDIENSSTFFRVAGGYMKLATEGIEGMNIKVFQEVMNEFDGYDTYKIDSEKYVRFNNNAYISNYRRNELLLTEMDVYCVCVGSFSKTDFDFLKRIKKMQYLFNDIDNDTVKTLADIDMKGKMKVTNMVEVPNQIEDHNDEIKLYDVIIATISQGDHNE